MYSERDSKNECSQCALLEPNKDKECDLVSTGKKTEKSDKDLKRRFGKREESGRGEKRFVVASILHQFPLR